MPISYDNAYDLSRDEARVFQRATVAAVRAALDLYGQGANTAGTAGAKLCTAVLAAPEQYGRLFAFVLCTDTQFATAAALRQASDATLLASVKVAWPAMAGG